MSKELIVKQDLERIAVQEIRPFPGCEDVTEVEIEYQVDIRKRVVKGAGLDDVRNRDRCRPVRRSAS
jgi:hypothetical protein